MLLARSVDFIMNNLEKIIDQCEANAVPDDKIDFSELPPITDFSGFKPLQPEYFKPKREQVSIRMNKILVDHFRSTGKGWQSRVNDFLMKAVANGQI